MIELNGISKNESGCYTSAYARCVEMIENQKVKANEAIDSVVTMFSMVVEDTKQLQQYLYEQLTMEIEPEAGVYSDDAKQSTWWTDFKKDDTTLTYYWNRYERYLTEKEGWDLQVIEKSIATTTDRLMNALSNPLIKAPCSRYGMVFGYVQSGKTAHYIGLLNKAIDAGYKIIIVLAGMHNNLRSQTQSRIDEEVLGYETSLEWIFSNFSGNPTAIGVGEGRENQTAFWVSTLTSRDDKGDFNKKRAGVSVMPPILFVAKKNTTVLENLIEYFGKIPISKKGEGEEKYIDADYPMLMIDDEADQASINTNSCYDDNGVLLEKFDPTKINGLIRKILKMFRCKSYVGYTATPYANVFIPDNAFCESYGNDLFPKDFITKIPTSIKYVGAREFFGLKGEEDAEAMPLSKEIVKGASYLPAGSKKDVAVGELPEELKKAILAFVISTAVRNCRGQRTKPNTMLIHILRFVETQKKLQRRVKDYYEEIRGLIKFGDAEIIEELCKLWIEDFEPTTDKMLTCHAHHMSGIIRPSWESVIEEIKAIMRDDQIKVYSINGKSKDFLRYKEHKGKPYNVILVGGDKLSRGLTLEGLTVSYFTRNSRTYDTLMQMGRWFGYRPGYLDVCRLYVTKSLYSDFKHISMATEDLVDQIDYMNDLEETPENFGLRIATHPDMLISSRNKIKTGIERKMSFSNTLSQTRMIDIDTNQYARNFEATECLIEAMGEPVQQYWVKKDRVEMDNEHLFWTPVSGHIIAKFLTEYETSKQANRAQSKYMATYIKNQLQFGGLTDWTVCLINVGEKTLNIGGNCIGRGIKRTKDKGYEKSGNACSIKTMTSNGHEYYDFSKEQKDRVDNINGGQETYDRKKATYIRSQVRLTSQGLLLLYPLDYEAIEDLKIEEGNHKTPIGFAIVFPDNKGKGDLVSYRLNDVGMRNEELELCD